MNDFDGTDLVRAFDAGADAQFKALVEECEELMIHNDVGEALSFLFYYAEKHGLDTKVIEEKLKG